MDREAAENLIRNSPFARLQDPLCELLEPSIRIGARPMTRADLPHGASRFGGPADLPAGFAWPRSGERPLALVAQLQLADLAPFDPRQQLPPSGWLCFFLDTAEETPFALDRDRDPVCRVAYFEGAADALTRTEPPEPCDPRNEFPPNALAMAGEWTLPSFGSTHLAALLVEEDERDAYEKLVFALPDETPQPAGASRSIWQRLRDRLRSRFSGDAIHRALGHPEHLDHDPRIDWQRLSAGQTLVGPADPATREAAQQWLLLLQLDAFEGGPQWLWGDSGTFYFGIRQGDLAARNFDAVEWTVECG